MSGKAKAKGISASSFLDLKAELSKQEDEFSRSKAAGNPKFIVGGVKRPEKKPTIWARQNQGVSARASRDIELEAISKPTLDSARAALERKAKIYDKLKRGQTGGLNDKQYESLLVDPVSDFESDSDDLDESAQVPRHPLDDDDPIVEYEDEFGRMRTARRSEVPRALVPTPEEQAYDEDEDLVIHNPVGHFPVYRPSADRVAQIEKEHAEANNPLGVHYDASAEVRAKGAGFYQFSKDEETRKAQMDELKSARDETGKTRKETGALDVLPGAVEGMQDPHSASGRSRAMEKRKRELEERRKIVDAKRRKLAVDQDSASSSTAAKPDTAVLPAVAADPFAALEVASAVGQDSASSSTARVILPAVATVDPFAALEVASAKDRGKAKALPASNDADKFLAQLQQEFLGGKRK
ncbi:hypothetical protein DFH09DRAFT_1335042 [Mycena vulgaris]|nr:hypothetical protein DFH09DRAFT_1335042 [Mycena vulgaris]